MCIKVPRSPTRILAYWWGAIWITMLPFMIAQMVIYYSHLKEAGFNSFKVFDEDDESTHCLSTLDPDSGRGLMFWFVVDQWSKLLILVWSMVMAILGAAFNRYRSKVTVILWIAGVFDTIFFLYHLAWLGYGIYLFRSLVEPIIELGYNCDDRVKPFMWSLIVICFIVIMAHIILSFIRSDNTDLYLQHNFKPQPKPQKPRKRLSRGQSVTERKMLRTAYR